MELLALAIEPCATVQKKNWCQGGVVAESNNLDGVVRHVGNVRSSACSCECHWHFAFPFEIDWDVESSLFDVGSIIGQCWDWKFDLLEFEKLESSSVTHVTEWI